jgi:hypothetical protein
MSNYKDQEYEEESWADQAGVSLLCFAPTALFCLWPFASPLSNTRQLDAMTSLSAGRPQWWTCVLTLIHCCSV